MHLALISEHASPLAALGGPDAGGQNVYVAKTAAGLARLGHQVDVYTRRTDGEQPDVVALSPGLRVIHVSAGPPEDVPKESLYEHMPAFANEVITRMRREGSPDLVHAHFWMSGMVALELKRRLGVPFVVTFHALGKVRRAHQGDADRFPPARLVAESAVVAGAERIIAECPQDAEDLRKLYQAPSDKLVQVPCGFDPEEMGPVDRRLARELLGIDPDSKVVLQLGRMVPRKGVDDAIRGFARATAKDDRDAMMLIVGGDLPDDSVIETPEGSRLFDIAVQEGVADRVRFMGSRSRDSLRYYYAAADVFISVPWYEPFGITPLEAMACGVPVVGSNVGGIKFTVMDGLTGILVEPHDPNAVAEALKALLGDAALRERMGSASQERVKAHFTWDNVTTALDGVYAEFRKATEESDVWISRSGTSLGETARSLSRFVSQIEPEVAQAARLIANTVLMGGTVFICGTGSSAASAQGLAGELVGRLTLGRQALPAIALTNSSAVVTGVCNDFGGDQVFAHQIDALGGADDLLVTLSVVGRSPNVTRALESAREAGMRAIGLFGREGGPAAKLCDIAICVPTRVTARVEEVHQIVLHHFVDAVDDAYAALISSNDPAYSASIPQEYLA